MRRGELAAAAGAAALTAWIVNRRVRGEFWYDEMWRADLIGARDFFGRYPRAGAPLPPGWVLPFKAADAAAPGRPWVLRGVNLAANGAFLAGAAVLLRAVAPRRSAWTAAGAVLALAVAPEITGVAQYLNNYVLEAAYVAWMLALAVQLDEHPRLAWPLLGLVAAAPLFLLSGLSVVPAVAVGLARRLPAGRRGALAGAAAVCAGLAAWVYTALYRPVVSADLVDWWAEETLSGGRTGLSALLAKSLRQLHAGLFDPESAFGGAPLAAAGVALALAGFGLAAAGRRSALPAAALASAWLATVALSAVSSWPMTPVRVNHSYVWLAPAFAALGLLELVRRAAADWGAAVAGAGLVAGLWPGALAHLPETFGIGLTEDLAVVAASPAARNVVVAYHPYTEVFVHDRLVNRGGRPGAFTILAEAPGERSLYDSLDAALAPSLGPAGGEHAAVWCVMPYEIGPEAAEAACRFSPGARTRAVAEQGARARIEGWLPPG